MNNAIFAARVLALVPRAPRRDAAVYAGRAIGWIRPIPVQTRCPGCKDVPACSRAVLPGTGYCPRCGQLINQVSQAA